MEKVSWHDKRGNWAIKAVIVAALCAFFIYSVNEIRSDWPLFLSLAAIVIYTFILKIKEHGISQEVETLKTLAEEYRNTFYTEDQIESQIDNEIIGLNAMLLREEKWDMNDPIIRAEQREKVIGYLERDKKEAQEKYFKQVARFQAMGYTKEEIEKFHDLTYKNQHTDMGGWKNLFMLRLQDNKKERTIKIIVGILFVLFWGYEIGYFIADNSPFIQWVKRFIIIGIIGYVYASIANFFGIETSEKTFKTCGTCGNMYSGVFCGCFWASYENYKK